VNGSGGRGAVTSGDHDLDLRHVEAGEAIEGATQ